MVLGQNCKRKTREITYVVVFRKTEIKGVFDLEFMDLKSTKFAKLLNESARKGTVGHTTARQYGWF